MKKSKKTSRNQYFLTPVLSGDESDGSYENLDDDFISANNSSEYNGMETDDLVVQNKEIIARLSPQKQYQLQQQQQSSNFNH